MLGPMAWSGVRRGSTVASAALCGLATVAWTQEAADEEVVEVPLRWTAAPERRVPVPLQVLETCPVERPPHASEGFVYLVGDALGTPVVWAVLGDGVNARVWIWRGERHGWRARGAFVRSVREEAVVAYETTVEWPLRVAGGAVSIQLTLTSVPPNVARNARLTAGVELRARPRVGDRDRPVLAVPRALSADASSLPLALLVDVDGDGALDPDRERAALGGGVLRSGRAWRTAWAEPSAATAPVLRLSVTSAPPDTVFPAPDAIDPPPQPETAPLDELTAAYDTATGVDLDQVLRLTRRIATLDDEASARWLHDQLERDDLEPRVAFELLRRLPDSTDRARLRGWCERLFASELPTRPLVEGAVATLDRLEVPQREDLLARVTRGEVETTGFGWGASFPRGRAAVGLLRADADRYAELVESVLGGDRPLVGRRAEVYRALRAADPDAAARVRAAHPNLVRPIQKFEDDEADWRHHVWRHLAKRRRSEQPPAAWSRAARAEHAHRLAGCLDPALAVSELLDAASDEHPDDTEARTALAQSIARFDAAIAREPLQDALRSDHPTLRRVAAEALGELGDTESISKLLAAARATESRHLVRTILDAVVEIGDPEVVPRLFRATSSTAPWPVEHALAAARLSPTDARTAKWISRRLRDDDATARVTGLRVASIAPSDRTRDAIEALLADPDWRVRLHAARACAAHRDGRSITRLVERLGTEPRRGIRTRIESLLAGLTGHFLSGHGAWSVWAAEHGASFVPVDWRATPPRPLVSSTTSATDGLDPGSDHVALHLELGGHGWTDWGYWVDLEQRLAVARELKRRALEHVRSLPPGLAVEVSRGDADLFLEGRTEEEGGVPARLERYLEIANVERPAVYAALDDQLGGLSCDTLWLFALQPPSCEVMDELAELASYHGMRVHVLTPHDRERRWAAVAEATDGTVTDVGARWPGPLWRGWTEYDR